MAIIGDTIISRIIETVGKIIEEEVAMQLGVKEELKILVSKLEMISTILNEVKSMGVPNTSITLWRDKLRAVVEEADNIKEECESEAEKLKEKSASDQSTVRCCCLPLYSCFHRVTFRHEIGNKIKDINARLELLYKEKSDLSLQLSAGPNSFSRVNSKSSPIHTQSDVVGIDEDVNNVVKLILNENQKKNCVFAIVGMAGIGKTTLAQAVYNDERVSQFGVKIWLCVTKDFSVTDILKQIIRSSGRSHGDAQEIAELTPLVEKSVRDKRLFLVLDDMWDANLWVDLLKHCLQYDNPTSRILVTTQNELVAREMGAIYFHKVNSLSEKYGWLMFCKLVFGDEMVEECMKDIGKQIVKKCGGLPLAIKIIAGVIRTKDVNVREWGKVLHSEAWSSKEIPNKILPALYMSYQDLPSQLEQCFLCSTLFSRTFTRPFAVSVWLSEGFITPNGDTSLEELGNDCYRELVRRNIFMVNPTYYDESACMMHDLVRGLAVSMGQGAYYSGDLQGLKNSPTKPRHISLVDDVLSTIPIPNEIVDCDSLRTLMCRTPQLNNIPADLFEKHRRLRVLVLSWTKIERLPLNIGYLIHLRYLNVSCTGLEELPESVGLLRNLLFLVLHGCQCLHNLPNSIVRLHKLRSIVLLNTPISQMPKGIGELKDLQVLSGFVLGDKRSVSNQGSTMEDLKHLTLLTNLVCYHLERVPSGTEAKEAALGSKPSLRHLELHCDEQRSPEEEEKERIKQVFEKLCPPPCIENIEIHFFFGRELPSWLITINSSFLSNLGWLKLTNCEYIQRLPSLGRLPQLKHLSIQGASMIVAVGPEFFGESGEGFPKLEEMYIKDMPNWEDWHLTQWPNDRAPLLPCLRKLALEGCPKLKSIPGTLIRRATSLKDLHICKAGNLSNLVEHSASITKAVILDCPLLEDISNLPLLQHLDIGGCPAIQRMDNMCSLKYLLLRDKGMEALPDWMQSIMMQLQRLELWVNPDFIRQCLPLNGPDQPKIILHNPSRIFDETVETQFHTRSPYSFRINLTPETMEGVTVLPLDETSQHSQI